MQKVEPGRIGLGIAAVTVACPVYRLNEPHTLIVAKRVAAGETITLLCSTACTDESHCHRSLLKQLIEERMAAGTGP